jgi:hypothetical protein
MWGLFVDKILLPRMQWNQSYLGQRSQESGVPEGWNSSQRVQASLNGWLFFFPLKEHVLVPQQAAFA